MCLLPHCLLLMLACWQELLQQLVPLLLLLLLGLVRLLLL
jgi:hypothetical protein